MGRSTGETTRDPSLEAGGAGSGGWTLVVVGHGEMRVDRLPASGELLIGRDATCDVVLDHHRVSRRHARLQVGATCSIEDLGSRNGTRVGGETLAAERVRRLAPGDGISLGPFMLVLVRDQPASALPATSSVRVEDPAAAAASPTLAAIAGSPVNLLLRGETGVGKEVLAETLHRLSGRTGPFLRLNCAAIGEPLLESELFGHERGAFTGAVAAKPGLLEVAAGGTVLLDEIGELPLPLQAKLLRAVEEHEILRVGGLRPAAIDVRFIAASHRDLLADVGRGGFRVDLYYRLAGMTLDIPPLRERPGRIAPLAQELLERAATRAGRSVPRLAAAAAARLHAHPWPGNVRELRNVMDRALLLAGDGRIEPAHILFDAPLPTSEPAVPPAPSTATAAPDPAADAERERIIAALDACGGNQTRAAKQLGIARSTLATKLAILRIPRPRSK